MELMLSNLMEAVVGNRPFVSSDYSHPLICEHKELKNIAVIVISSDRGLCGSFNTNLLRYVKEFLINELQIKCPEANIKLITVGKKSAAFYKKTRYNIIYKLSDIFSKLEFQHSKSITEVVKSGFISENIDKVYLFYNEFVNVIKQIPVQKVLLPIPRVSVPNSKEHITAGKYNVNYIFEPGKEAILNDLIPKLLDLQLWRALLESSAAEQAARMMAMDNATTNALELIDHLELVFNKARQAMITKEMLEIVSGAEALKST